ncbi:MAG: amino acid ABC transporter permease [Beijerinckiaceae bacterium]|nr:amino acid ABC transporter permease [Beijerinckiaceae bacterium]
MTAPLNSPQVSYVRTASAEALPPPTKTSGAAAWIRDNLFSSVGNTLLTLIGIALAYVVLSAIIPFMFTNATFTGANRDACIATANRPVIGACWAYVATYMNYFVYGSYPIDQRWRVDILYAMFVFGATWMLWLDAPKRGLGALFFFVILPVSAFFLLHGLPAIGLETVTTERWGGMLVTFIVAIVGIVVSLPFGILLALGRRSNLPIVKMFCVLFIEFVRGVPLITVLFAANFMLPLFLPPEWNPDRLLRALVAVALFSSAYMAEVVRAGLQALPKGQYEGADAMGLSYWQGMRLIILPQALKATLPNIVNSNVALFKDTTLVSTVGIFDFVTALQASFKNPEWATSVTSTTGLLFAASFYFVCCFGMSKYANFIEKRLAKADKR